MNRIKKELDAVYMKPSTELCETAKVARSWELSLGYTLKEVEVLFSQCNTLRDQKETMFIDLLHGDTNILPMRIIDDD